MHQKGRQVKTFCFVVVAALLISGFAAGCSGRVGDTGKQETATADTNTTEPTASDTPTDKPVNHYPTQALLDTAGKRITNFFGIHALIYPEDDMNMHMGWAEHLVGKGGYVKERFEPVTKATHGPSTHWINFLKQCYKRDLIPVVKIGGTYTNDYSDQPDATASGDYSELAAAIKSIFQQLPMKKGVPIYVELYNEVNLNREWSQETPDPEEYGRMLVQVSKALHSIGDPRIRVMNGALCPVGNYDNVSYVEAMVKKVPESLYAFDVWASHPYPHNHPPEFNIHDGTATIYRQQRLTIDSYLLELKVLEKYGRKDTKVILTETGYELGNKTYLNYPEIDDQNRAEYIVRAFRDYWSKWPEIIAVLPFEMCGAQPKNWTNFDWVQIYSESDANGYPTDYYPQYKAVADLEKPPYVPEPALQNTEDKNMEIAANKGNMGPEAEVSTSTSIENWGWTQAKLNNSFTADADLGWSSGGDQGQDWVIYAFKEAKQFSKVVLVPRSDGAEAGKFFPQAFEVQVSDDGQTWKTVYTFKKTGEGLFNPGTAPQEYSFGIANGKYLRLLVTEKTNNGEGDGYHAQLSELEVY